MWKKLLILLVIVFFAFGASGGCLNEEPPNLAGTWEGTLSRDENPTIQDFADVTMELEQDASGNLSGSVYVTYNPGTDNEVALPQAIISSESSTDNFSAEITAEGTNTGLFPIVINCGDTTSKFSIPAGEDFTLKFNIPHFYACRGGSLTELVGTYVLKDKSSNTIDSGAINLTKTE